MSQHTYHILRSLGSGGSGGVSLAEDRERGGRLLVIKHLHDGMDPGLLSHELDTLRRLVHPNIASVLDYDNGTTREGAFLVE